MRGQDHSGLTRLRTPLAGSLLGGMLVFICGAIYAQNAPQNPATIISSR
jgi:cytochrome c-type protein NapB